MGNKVKVSIANDSQSQVFELRKGLGLQALVELPAELLEFDCRKADCGICILRVLEGEENLSEKTAREADFLKAMHADSSERLACQCRVFGDVKFHNDSF